MGQACICYAQPPPLTKESNLGTTVLPQPQPWRRTQEARALLQRILDNDRYLTKVDLEGKGLSDGDARDLAAALKTNTNIRCLWLFKNDISDDGAVALAGVLRANSNLIRLGLGGNRIRDWGAKALAWMVRHNSAIELLDLGGNSIEDEGGRALAMALIHNSTLEWLFLNDNSISDGGAEALACAICLNPSLARLDLCRNRIGERGTRALASAMQNLGGGGVDQEDMTAFVTGLFEENAAVQLGLEELGAIQQCLALDVIGGGQFELQNRPLMERQPITAKRTGQAKLLEAAVEVGMKKLIRDCTQMESECAPLVLERVGATIRVAGVFSIMLEQPPNLFVPQMTYNMK